MAVLEPPLRFTSLVVEAAGGSTVEVGCHSCRLLCGAERDNLTGLAYQLYSHVFMMAQQVTLLPNVDRWN